MTFLVAISSLAALVYLLAYCRQNESFRKSIFKTVSVAGLALAAQLSGAPMLLVAALSLCALGDLLLSRDAEPAFLAGVGAFAAGHLAYVALFLTSASSEPGRLLTPSGLAFTNVLALYGLWMMRLLWRHAGALRYAVLGYVPVILAMGLAAVTLPGTGWQALILPAALAFMLSDSMLAAEMFFLPKPHSLRRITPYIVWFFYWIAQLGFLLAHIAPQFL